MIFLPIIMAFLARLSGGGLFTSRLFWKQLPKALFAVPFGLYLGVTEGMLWGIIGWGTTFAAFCLGHGTIYAMQGYHDHNRDNPDKPRIEVLDYILMPVFKLFGWNVYHPMYSWVGMGLKGLLIGLPIAPWGLLLAFLWPVSYWIGHRIERNPAVAEWVSGMMAGMALGLAFM